MFKLIEIQQLEEETTQRIALLKVQALLVKYHLLSNGCSIKVEGLAITIILESVKWCSVGEIIVIVTFVI